MAKAPRSCNHSHRVLSAKPVHPSDAPPMASRTITTARATPIPVSIATRCLDRSCHIAGYRLATSTVIVTRATTKQIAHNTCLFVGRQRRGLVCCSTLCVSLPSTISATIPEGDESGMSTFVSFIQRHIYAPPQDIVLSSMLHGAVNGLLRRHRTVAMQDRGCELPRIPLPRTWVNKGIKKGPG
jgi:hypothetical protein